jgi:ribosomal protein L44E
VVDLARGQVIASDFGRGRKVRTRQDTVVGNAHRPMIVGQGKVPQRVDRRLRSVRVKGCGKSAPLVW